MIVRELFAKLGLDVDTAKFTKGMLAAEAIKKGLESVVEWASEASHAFVEHIEQVVEFSEGVKDLAQKAGLTTEALQRLGAAAAVEGVSLETITHSFGIMSRTMVAAKTGNEEAAKAFKKAGTSIKDDAGKLRPANELFLEMADRFSEMEDGAEKTALAMKIFGRGGAEMIPLLNQGREEIEKYMAGAAVMTDEQIAAGKEIVVTQRLLAAQTAGIWKAAIGPLLPAMADLIKRFYEWKKANAEVMKARIQAFVGGLVKGIKFLASTFEFLIKNITTLKVILLAAAAVWAATHASMVRSAVVAAAKIAGAWLWAAAPFLAIAAVIAGIMLIFDDLRVYKAGGDSMFGRWKKTIDEWLKPQGQDVWFVAAIKQFLSYITEAIEKADELWNGMQRLNPFSDADSKAKQKQFIAENKINQRRVAMRKGAQDTNIEMAKRRLALGQGLTELERKTLIDRNIDPDQFAQQYGGGSAAAVSTAANVGYVPQYQSMVNQTSAIRVPQKVEINITQQPGESSKELADEIMQRQQDEWNRNMSDAKAQVSE